MKQLSILAIIIASLLMFSCMKDDEQTTGVGDAVIIVKKSEADTIYGLSLYAYTYSTFKTVTAFNSATPEKTYTLTANNGSFSYETQEDNYTTTKPTPGTFVFNATFENGVQQVFVNTLYDRVLPLPTFTECEYNAAKQQLELKWKLMNGATSYAINIFDGQTVVFASNELSGSTTAAYAIRSMRGGWAQDYVPEDGKTYTIRLFAYMFEPNGQSSNVQCVSMNDTTAVWGN